MKHQPRIDDALRNGMAVITGAGAGLGQALAVELSRRNVRVCGFGRQMEALAATQALCAPGLFLPKRVDVGDADAVAAAFAELRQDGENVTILVNNAAVYPRRDFLEETPASFMHSIGINLGGVVACTHAALETMSQTGFGRIVNVGSFADLAPLPCSSAYSVSKGAVRVFTNALVADLSDRFPDIVISVWMPGILATKMGMPEGLDPALAARWGANLTLWHDRSLNGVVFEQDRELLPPRSLKRRLQERLLMRKQRPRQIGTV